MVCVVTTEQHIWDGDVETSGAQLHLSCQGRGINTLPEKPVQPEGPLAFLFTRLTLFSVCIRVFV